MRRRTRGLVHRASCGTLTRAAAASHGPRLPRAARGAVRSVAVPGAHSADRTLSRRRAVRFDSISTRAATKWTRPQLSVDGSDPVPRFRSAARVADGATGEWANRPAPPPPPPCACPDRPRSLMRVSALSLRRGYRARRNTVYECMSPFSRCLFAYFYCTRMRCRRARQAHLEILSLISRGLQSKCP